MFISKRRSLVRRITWAVVGCAITVGIGLSSAIPSTPSNNYVAAVSSGSGGGALQPKPKPKPTPKLYALSSNTFP